MSFRKDVRSAPGAPPSAWLPASELGLQLLDSGDLINCPPVAVRSGRIPRLGILPESGQRPGGSNATGPPVAPEAHGADFAPGELLQASHGPPLLSDDRAHACPKLARDLSLPHSQAPAPGPSARRPAAAGGGTTPPLLAMLRKGRSQGLQGPKQCYGKSKRNCTKGAIWSPRRRSGGSQRRPVWPGVSRPVPERRERAAHLFEGARLTRAATRARPASPFTARRPAGARVAAVSGGSQAGVIVTLLPQPLVVQLLDATGGAGVGAGGG